MEDFAVLFNCLRDVLGKPANDQLCRVYWSCLQSCNPTIEEIMAVMTAFINNPPGKFPSPEDIKGGIRQHRANQRPALPLGRSPFKNSKSPEDAIANARAFRLTLLTTVYQGQGESKFYKALLQSGGSPDNVFARIARKVAEADGVRLEDIVVTHEDVLAAIAHQEAA